MELGTGIVEGFYGTPWSKEARLFAADRLQELGGKFYIYAPKGDPYLRKKWTETYPATEAEALRTFGRELHARGLSFGVGLSPYELYRAFDQSAQDKLKKKLEEIADLGADHLALLFDDMRGDLPNLATLQIEIIQFVQAFKRFKTLSFCPTYYTTDPVLDRVFGQRPEGYLEALGLAVDPSVHFYWTGEKVCSTEYSEAHLAEVTRLLKRKPLLWDNYPVNDGQRMCKFLHLKEFTGRPGRLLRELSGHAVNPMNEAYLSWIPMRTLLSAYAGKATDWKAAAEIELGSELAAILSGDAVFFQEQGLDVMSPAQKENFIAKYSAFDHPAAKEVVLWLKDYYLVTRELVLTQ